VAKRRRFEVRLTGEQLTTLKQTAQTRGFRSASAYVQNLLRDDVVDRKSDEPDRETIVAASIERLSKEIRQLHTGQQALFAVVDSLTRLFLTCIPEPPPEALDQARRRAKLRYSRFLVSVARNLNSDTQSTFAELVDRG
jgi:Arc/MetJ-type ribon-helix-helix transcriptional regulator